MTDASGPAEARLAALLDGSSTDEALAYFDELPSVAPDDMSGRWKGSELPTGHPMDGLLETSGWYGKQFDDPESVHPLLYSDPGGEIFAVEPRRLPMGLTLRLPPRAVAAGRKAVGVLKPVIRTTEPRARLRTVEFRGKASAAMVYDHLPIIDHFRRVTPAVLFGAMDMRGIEQPFFFVLRRDS